METLEEFYKHKFNKTPDNLQTDIAHFNIFRLQDYNSSTNGPYTRRDFYKIMLIRGRHLYHYSDKTVETKGSTLMFFNPGLPYKYERLDDNPTGCFCIFKEAFFSGNIRGGIKDLPMFTVGAKPFYQLNKTQDKYINGIFEKMHAELAADYQFKFDLIRNYIMEMVHYALKIQPSETLYQHADANARITAVFNELLERQFPIESPTQQFTLKSAKDFAGQLNVHTNHLNRAIRITTGKTTTSHIAERLTSEAMTLLKHTSWNIAEISYSLGFEEPSYFNHFFKKQTSFTPSAFRTKNDHVNAGGHRQCSNSF